MIFVFSGLPNKDIEKICEKFPSFKSNSYSVLQENYALLMVIYSKKILNIGYYKFNKNSHINAFIYFVIVWNSLMYKFNNNNSHNMYVQQAYIIIILFIYNLKIILSDTYYLLLIVIFMVESFIFINVLNIYFLNYPA